MSRLPAPTPLPAPPALAGRSPATRPAPRWPGAERVQPTAAREEWALEGTGGDAPVRSAAGEYSPEGHSAVGAALKWAATTGAPVEACRAAITAAEAWVAVASVAVATWAAAARHHPAVAEAAL